MKATRKKPTIANVFVAVPAALARRLNSIEFKKANIKLDDGVKRMLDIIMGIVKINKLRPLASSTLESENEKITIRNSKKRKLATQPGIF
jgi:hypothetical protein